MSTSTKEPRHRATGPRHDTGMEVPVPVKYTPDQREQAFWAKVNKDGPVPDYAPHLGNCWLWLGTLSHGHGHFKTGEGRSYIQAHHFLTGKPPAGLVTDHLCRVRACVRPSHLEFVTFRVNTIRGVGWAGMHAQATHCPQGHPYDEANTYRDLLGRRYCRTCRRLRDLARRPARRDYRARQRMLPKETR